MGLKVVRSAEVSAAINNICQKYNLSLAIVESFVTDFEEYKKLSVNSGDVPLCPYHKQLARSAYIDTIGRDKLNERTQAARNENIHHVHLWQTGCIWENENGDPIVQYNCTSDSYIIYSYFIDKDGEHHFYIIDLIFDHAHTVIEDNNEIAKWVAQARKYRLANT